MIDLLATKFHIPTSTHNLLPRSHIMEQLDEGISCKLTLVSASAGFGKSTLLSQWISRNTHPVAWLSLDANDNDPYRFLLYLIASLQRIELMLDTRLLKSFVPPEHQPTRRSSLRL